MVHADRMTQSIIHQPRVAWDGARAFVRAAGAPDYALFDRKVRSRLGVEFADELGDTRWRLLTAGAETLGDRRVTDIELGRWRVRLEDLLHTRPDLIDAVLELIDATR
jgi:hypothetical protein